MQISFETNQDALLERDCDGSTRINLMRIAMQRMERATVHDLISRRRTEGATSATKPGFLARTLESARLMLFAVEEKGCDAPEENLQPRGQSLGEAFRSWLASAIDTMEKDASVSELRYPSHATSSDRADGSGGQGTVLERPKGTTSLKLTFANQTLDEIDLSFLKFPDLQVVIDHCNVDFINLSGAHLNDIWIRNVAPHELSGVTCVGARLIVERRLFIWGEPKYPNSNKPEDQLRNVFVHIDLHGLRAAAVSVSNLWIVGGFLLDYLSGKKEADAYAALYPYFSQSIMITDSEVKALLLYNTWTTALVSLRSAKLERRLKFEQCHFEGIRLRKWSDRSDIVRDHFDYDDLTSLNGLVLDISRMKLDGELIFRDINPKSAGWINFAHSVVGLFNFDASLAASKSQGGNPRSQLRFRLNGFQYNDIELPVVATVRELEKISGRSGKSQRIGPAGSDAAADKHRNSANKEGQKASQHVSSSWEDLRDLLCRQLPPDLTHQFAAQPWTAAAMAYHRQGDYGQASKLLHLREKYWHTSLFWRWWKSGIFTSFLRYMPAWLFHWVFSRLPGFGHALHWPFIVLVVAWLGFGAFYHHEFKAGMLMQNPEAMVERPTETIGAIGSSIQTASNTVRTKQPESLQHSGSAESNRRGSEDSMLLSDSVSERVELSEEQLAPRVRSDWPQFNAFAYSLDVLVPALDMSQEKFWIPGYHRADAEIADKDGSSQILWLKSGSGARLDRLWWAYWIEIFVGWYLTVVIGFGFAGLFERRIPS